MNDLDRTKNAYEEIATTYTSGYLALPTLEKRKTWYSEVAEAYNKARPRYPQELISHAIELAQLPKDAIILEVGCGPGTATTAFAKLGFSIVCLEPSQEACLLARQNCASYSSVEVLNSTLEEWDLETQRFHGVLAANSWHWIPAEIGYPKVAAALQKNGSLMLLWNTVPQPLYEIYQSLNEVYQIHAPFLARYEQKYIQEEQLKKFEQTVIDSGLFKDLVSEQMACQLTYSIENYLMLLSTLSPYIKLNSQKRNALFEGLREILGRNCGESIQLSYLSAFQIAKKI